MQCFLEDGSRVEVSKKLEAKIQATIKAFHLYVHSAYGLEANNDGGIDDVSYSREYFELEAENFIVSGDSIVGYRYKEYTASFDGKKETVIFEWDNTDHSGWNDQVDRGAYEIVRKTK
ncbi:MAG: hypothetical protein IJY62_01660 [Clostridia bacterium]|nr:hypothetical protein [Clostridia bacterium]